MGWKKNKTRQARTYLRNLKPFALHRVHIFHCLLSVNFQSLCKAAFMKPIIAYIFLESFPEVTEALENWLLINSCSAFFHSDLWQRRTVSRPIEFVFAHNEIWELCKVLVIKMLWFYIIGWLPSTVAVFGNALVIFLIASRRRLHSLPNMFVLSLAVSDFIVGLIFFPTDFFCKKMALCKTDIPHLVAILGIFTSVWNLCAMTVDRYIAIIQPLRYITLMTHRRAALLTVFAWIFPLSLDFIPALCSQFGRCNLMNKNLILSKLILLEILPCLFLFITTTHIIITATRHRRQNVRLDTQVLHNHKSGQRRRGAKESAAATVIISILLIFLACYSVEFYSATGYLLFNTVPTEEVVTVINFLMIVNSSANPIAYALFKKDIRKELTKALCKTKSTAFRHPTTSETTGV